MSLLEEHPVPCRNELGIRLQGPKPQFARPDVGEGGSHPSNVHDHVYALGTVNFTGEALPESLPVVLHASCLADSTAGGHAARCWLTGLKHAGYIPSKQVLKVLHTPPGLVAH